MPQAILQEHRQQELHVLRWVFFSDRQSPILSEITVTPGNILALFDAIALSLSSIFVFAVITTPLRMNSNLTVEPGLMSPTTLTSSSVL